MDSAQKTTRDVHIIEQETGDGEKTLVLDVGVVEDKNVSVDVFGDTAIIVRNGETVAELSLSSRDVTVKTNNGVFTIAQ